MRSKKLSEENLSILRQKQAGTYERNKQIRKLYEDGVNMANLGRMFKITRQGIRSIVNQFGK